MNDVRPAPRRQFASRLAGTAPAWFWNGAAGAVLLVTCSVVLLQLSDARNSWVHPELVSLPEYIRHSRTDHPLLTVFDWSVFEPHPSRLRFLSDLGQVLDALGRRVVSYPLPALSLSAAIMVFCVPWAFYATIRSWDLARAAALALTAILISTTGFLSCVFIYCRPAKPISLALLALGIYHLSRYILSGRRRNFVAILLISLLGLYTDELLIWFVPFAAFWTLQRNWRNRDAWLAWAIVPVGYALVLGSLQVCYQTWGRFGSRPISAIASQNLLPRLWEPEIWKLALQGAARKLLTAAGFSNHSNTAVGCAVAVMVAGLIVLALRYGRQAWPLGVFAISGFLSFSAWGQWIHSYHANPALVFDYSSYSYYYHAPIVLFIVLCFAWLWRRNQQHRTILLTFAAVLIVRNLMLFSDLNRVIQLAHFGRYGSEAILGPLRNRTQTQVDLSNKGDDVEREFVLRAERLYPSGWRECNFHRDFQYFREHEYVDHYPTQLCEMFIAPCPLEFKMPKMPAQPPYRAD